MHHFLSFQDQRVLKIVKRVIVEDKDLTILDIQTMNNCSKRTVYNDLYFIEETWGQMLGYQIKGDQIYFENKSMGIMRIVVQKILQTNLSMQIMFELVIKPFQRAEDLAHKFYVSKSKVIREISAINQHLKPYGLYIDKRKSFYFWHELNFDETRLRVHLSRLLWGQQAVINTIQFRDLDLFKDFMDTVVIPPLVLNDLQKEKFMLLIYSAYLREAHGFHFTSSSRRKHPHHPIADLWGTQLYHHVLNFSDHFKDVLSENTLNNATVQSFTQSFLKQFQHNYQKDDLRLLINNLSLQVQYYNLFPYIGEQILNREQLFGYRFAKQNPVLFQKITQTVRYFEHESRISIKDYIFDIIFHSSLLFPEKNIQSIRKILVISDYGYRHAAFLKYKMIEHFPSLDIDCQSLDNYLQNQEFANQYDIIVSTWPNIHNIDKPWIIVGDVLSDQDFRKIFQKLYAI